MLTLSFSVLLFCLHIISSFSQAPPDPAKRLRCNLVWVPSSTGDILPETAVESRGPLQYVSRYYLEDSDSYRVGTYSPLTNLSSITNEDVSIKRTTSFDILTNPYGCRVVWEDVRAGVGGFIQSHFVVHANSTSGINLVGRALDPWVSGHVIFSDQTPRIFVTPENSTENDQGEAKGGDFQILLSFSDGMNIIVQDFQMDLDFLENKPDLMGIDEIVNDSPATLKQTLTHKRKITEVFTVKLEAKLSVRTAVTVSAGVNLIVAGGSTSTTVTKQVDTDITAEVTKTTVTEVVVEREVIVPPYSAVMACSTVDIKDAIKIPYIAKAVFSAIGLDPEDILKEILPEVPDAVIENGMVVIETIGEFLGSVVVKSDFFVGPRDDAEGCRKVGVF